MSHPVLNKLCYNGCAVQHSDKSSMAQCPYHCAISTVLKVLCYKDSADQQSTKCSVLIAKCCIAQCCLAQFQQNSANTQFWLNLQHVAKYVLFVLFFSQHFVSVLFFTLFPYLTKSLITIIQFASGDGQMVVESSVQVDQTQTNQVDIFQLRLHLGN